MSVELIRKEIKMQSDPAKAKFLSRFFKTDKGEYGEGDIFLGITVPEQRKIAIKFKDLPLKDVENLLKSKIHEERLIALLLLVHNFKNGNQEQKEEIYNFYLRNARYINNWDLVDISCPKIVGHFLMDKNRSILYHLAKSSNVWERRIAIISTFEFIRNNEFNDTIKISKILQRDQHDLIRKAVGWALREIGKKDVKTLENFLKDYYKQMPRTMLRYAIEKFSEKTRKKYLNGKI